jgi:hypothetical protein
MEHRSSKISPKAFNSPAKKAQQQEEEQTEGEILP